MFNRGGMFFTMTLSKVSCLLWSTGHVCISRRADPQSWCLCNNTCRSSVTSSWFLSLNNAGLWSLIPFSVHTSIPTVGSLRGSQYAQIPPSSLRDSGKPTCVGVAVVFTQRASWCCQLDNVLIYWLYFAARGPTIAVPLPGCSRLAGGGLPTQKYCGQYWQ